MGDILDNFEFEAIDDVAQARSALVSFMSIMKEWESRFYRQKRSALEEGRDVVSINDRERKNLSEILERWSFPDKTNQGRLIDLGCSDPPTYDPEIDVEDSVESKGGEVIFTIRQTVGLLTKSRFTMKKKGGEWMVKKKEFFNYKDRWQRSVL
ncbi:MULTISPECIES: NTF2 fold immunity protein [Burkholderia]|uniref:NTF2 fold immunity protein n=1 Tax=Burkholderia TaxID=32008 RepID=UPI00158327F6|nr:MULTISPECIES: NTF2 fold immunity protein [Burkholderia]